MRNGKSFGNVLPRIALLQIPVGHRHLIWEIRKILKIKVGLIGNARCSYIGISYFQLLLIVLMI